MDKGYFSNFISVYSTKKTGRVPRPLGRGRLLKTYIPYLSQHIQNARLLEWKFKTGWVGDSPVPPTLGMDGTIYVSGILDASDVIGKPDWPGGWFLYALNPDGSLKWEYKHCIPHYCSQSISPPVIGKDGTLYAISSHLHSNSYLIAISSNGSLKWKFKIDRFMYDSPSVSDETVYVPTCEVRKWVGGGWCQQGALYAIDLSGKLKWKFKTVFWATEPTIASDGTVYFIGCDKENENSLCERQALYAVKPDGKLKWKFTVGFGQGIGTPAISRDGKIYFAADVYIYAMDKNGKQLWKFKTTKGGFSQPAIASDGMIYFGSCDVYKDCRGWSCGCRQGALYKLTSQGNLVWKFTTGKRTTVTTPTIGDNGTLYFGVSYTAYYLYAVKESGELLWKFKPEHLRNQSISESQATISHDGTIYVTSGEYLYALKSNSGGLAKSSWPKFRGNAQNTGGVKRAFP